MCQREMLELAQTHLILTKMLHVGSWCALFEMTRLTWDSAQLWDHALYLRN